MQTPPPGSPHLTTHGRYKVLGQLSDKSLDHLLGIARDVLGMRVALVALLGRGGWFEQAIGVPPEEAPSLFPFCGYALVDQKPFSIADLREHDRLADEKRVRNEPGLRACAGTVLRGQDGRVAGAFVLFDYAPRALDEAAQRHLAEIARQIELQLDVRGRLLDLRGRHSELLGRAQMLEGVLRAARRYSIISTDLDGRIRTFNEGAEALLGFRAAEVVGRETLARFHDGAELEARARRVAAERSQSGSQIVTPIDTLLARARAGEIDEREWTYRHRGGHRFPVSLMIAAAHSEEGDLTGFVAIAQDITERKAAERMKDEFISIVSHELRTPLTAILGSLGLLAGGALGVVPDEMKPVVDIAHANSRRMVGLVNDILDLAKIESGIIDFRLQPSDLAAIVRNAVEEYRGYGAEFGVDFAVDEPLAGAIVDVDADRITQVMANLLSNAAKFSPRGSTVHVSLAEIDGAVRVGVSDRGPGLPEAFRPHVFHRFRQAESSDGRKRSGTGLGLHIVRLIVQNHGGRVGFDTAEGEGTTFWFELPLRADPTEAAPPIS